MTRIAFGIAAVWIAALPASLAGFQIGADTLPPRPEEIPALLVSGEGRAAGLAGIEARIGALPPERATPWVQLMAVAEKSGRQAGSLAARALLRAEDDGGVRGSGLVDAELGGLPDEDRPALLAFAAHLAEGPDPRRALELRLRLLEAHPEAPEAHEARLRAARTLLARDGDRERARALLEELIVGAPNHPLAPAARRLLQELRSGPGS